MLLAENQARGRDAAGFAFLDNGHITAVKNTGPADQLVADVSQHMPDTWDRLSTSPIVVAHTRAQTQGTARDNANNHPVVWGSWAVVHNGMVLNDNELFERQGVPRFAEVDTAAIPLLLETEATGADGSPFDSLALLGGSVSAAMWSQDKPTELALCRLGGPEVYLFLAPDQQLLVFSSAASVFRKLQRLAVGDLLFTTASQLPDKRLLLLRPDRATTALHEVERRPFYRARITVPPHTPVAAPAPPVGHASVTKLWRFRVSWETGNPDMPNRLPPDIGRLGAEPQFTHFDRDAAYATVANLEGQHVLVPTLYGTWHTLSPALGDTRVTRYFRPRKALKKLAHKRGWPRWWELAVVDPVRMGLDGTMAFDLITIKRESVTGSTTLVEPGVGCPHCGVVTAMYKQTAEACHWCYIRSRLPQALTRDSV